MKKTWDEIIQSDAEFIDLIGYGSILNSNSHEGDTSEPNTVIIHGFQRIYNLKMVPENFDMEVLESFRKRYWVKYDVHTIWDMLELQQQSVCVLNVEHTGKQEDIVNGVMIRIARKDFETYKAREEIYDLHQTPYSHINPVSWEIQCCEKWGYVLSAQAQYVIDNGHAFLPYHHFSRDGAYHFGEYFGKMFDDTTHNILKK